MVESVTYSFSGAVSLSSSDFTITGINGTTVVPTLTAVGSAGNTVWTVTFSGAGSTAKSINDGEYNIHLGSSFNTDFDFYRLLGDFDNSHTVDFNDWVTVANADGLPQRVDGRMAAPAAPGLGVTVRVESLGEPCYRTP